MNSRFYVAYGIMLASSATAFYVVDAIATALGAPPLIKTYLAIAVAIGFWMYFQKHYLKF